MRNNGATKRTTFSFFIPYFLFLICAASCSTQKQIARSAKTDVLENKALQAAHVGLSIFDPSTNTYLYNYQGDKYFVPASNTKIPTCYAAMKYLGDSLVAFKYAITAHTLNIWPNGDPTFQHPDFKNQPAFDFLVGKKKELYINFKGWEEQALGSGWAWNDYQEYYMAERSPMPYNGNVVQFEGNRDTLTVTPRVFADTLIYNNTGSAYLSNAERPVSGNQFNLDFRGVNKRTVVRTVDTKNGEIILQVLSGLLKTPVIKANFEKGFNETSFPSIRSQPTDSMLKPMMHRSDNFFAEQSLLMVSNEKLGVMNDSKIIDTILKTDFKDLPQKPRWADGSGLSRYNLFTPQDFVAILNKMKNEFGMERIKVIFPTGGEGTISSYYKADSGYIYGKTGTLSGVVAFSGFMYTKKGKLLIFSTLVNNHQASATDVRRAIEKFLQRIRKNY